MIETEAGKCGELLVYFTEEDKQSGLVTRAQWDRQPAEENQGAEKVFYRFPQCSCILLLTVLPIVM